LPEADDESRRRIADVISQLLRLGVIISAAVVFVGGVLFLLKHAWEIPSYRDFQGEPDNLRGVTGIIREVLRWDPHGIIQFGLLLLIATPVARVAFSVIAFARERDRKFVFITLIVLAALMYGLAGGKG
jgi:uncharacterized membrane protein